MNFDMYIYCKNKKKWTPKQIAVIILKFERCDFTIE